ncbi:MAG: Hpt domain-containing protein [Bacteroidetes bacterium]|nr:Hpt domain-containing protein [Bacteroidota bacterium]
MTQLRHSDPENKLLYDFEYLDELSDDDLDFKKNMILFFIENAPLSLEEIKLQHSNKNWKALREITHKYKPQIGFMGIKSIAEELETLEQSASKEVNIDAMPGLIERIEKISYLAITQLKNELERLNQF